MEEPVVSICCLAYNHEPYIRQCIEGFLMQKTTFPIEVLIHDDASTDKTADIIREYEAKYPDIIKPIYQKENQYSKGVGVSRVFQFPRAKGKYIAMCEGDDYWTDPLKLQKQFDVMERDDSLSFCFHQSFVVNEMLDYPDSHFFVKIKNSCRLTFKDVIRSWWLIPTQSLFLKKNCVQSYEWMKEVPNGDLCIELTTSLKGDIFYLSDPMSVYRQHYNGISTTIKDGIKHNRNLIFIYQHIKEISDIYYTDIDYAIHRSEKTIKHIQRSKYLIYRKYFILKKKMKSIVKILIS